MVETIETRTFAPEARTQDTPVLIQQGLFHDLRLLEPLAERLAGRGFEVTLHGLPGHGKSSCDKGELAFYNFEDYLNPLGRTLARSKPMPLVVTHGAALLMVMRLLEDKRERTNEVGELPGLVALAPMPPTGLSAFRRAVTARHPLAARRAAWRKRPSDWLRPAARATQWLVGSDATIPGEDLVTYVHDESWQVVEQLTRGLDLRPRRSTPRTLFVRGAEDALSDAGEVEDFAAELGATLETIPGAGHVLTLEPCVEEIAGKIAAWASVDARATS